MKRCPQCGRDYNDPTLSFCLDDGAALLDGPASADEPLTAILPEGAGTSESPTRTLEPADAEATKLYGGKAGETSPRGKRLMAGIAGIVVVAALAIGGYWFFGGGSSKQIESIAVLPFVNESRDQDVEYLSDGMTDSLITSLSQIPGLNIKARSSVFRYKGKDVGMGAIGEELGVQAILTGRVTQRDDQVSLTLELVEAASENIVWSRKYDRTLKDLVALQNEIAEDVHARIRSMISGNSEPARSGVRTENPEAYTAYLKGLYHFNKRESEDNLKALEYFRKAAQLDPDYALAYVGIANAVMLVRSISSESRRAQAFEALEKARTLAPESSEVHASLGVNYYYWGWDWEKAEREFQTAIKLNPADSSAHHWYAEALCYQGRFEECFEHFGKALEIDPLSLAIISDRGIAYFRAGKYDEAKKELERAIDLDPDFDRSYTFLSRVFEETGEFEKAAEYSIGREWGREEDETQRQKADDLVKAYRASGPRGYWQERLEWVLERERESGISSPWQAAHFYARLGEKDKAFEQLELALKARGYAAASLWVDPAMDSLRSDPRFDEMLDRTGLFKNARNKRKYRRPGV